jgi:hypothetical protein
MRLAWRYGGPKERFFAVFIPVAPLISVGVAFGFIISGMSVDEDIQVLFAVLGMVAAWPSVMSALYDSAYSEEWHRQAMERGWIRANEREYYKELMRFRAECGSGGHSPGQMKWGFAYAVAYVAVSVTATPLVLLLYPSLGHSAFVPVLFGTIISFLVLGIGYSAHVQHLFRDAETKGYRLRELRRAFR